MGSLQQRADGAPSLTREEVAKNNTVDSLWCIVDHRVYDMTDFVDAHRECYSCPNAHLSEARTDGSLPAGGSVVLVQVAGTDATTAFYNLHRHSVIEKYRPSLCLGTLEGETPEVVEMEPGDLSSVPYAEPLWLTPTFKSPYYDASHRALRRELRAFVDTHVKPEAQAKELDGTYISQELLDRMAEANVLGMRLGPGKHLHGLTMLGGVKGEKFDYFHDLITSQELARCNARGFQDGAFVSLSLLCMLACALARHSYMPTAKSERVLLMSVAAATSAGNLAGMMISLTAVRQWLPDGALKDRITRECLSGQKKICLAVTEAFAGSDVAGLKTTAVRSADGSHYVVNGTKKWITNGVFCDYFVTGCKTEKGFSVLLIERGEGVDTTRIKTSYSTAAGSTLFPCCLAASLPFMTSTFSSPSPIGPFLRSGRACTRTQKSERLDCADTDLSVRHNSGCLLYTSPSPRDGLLSRMPSSA